MNARKRSKIRIKKLGVYVEPNILKISSELSENNRRKYGKFWNS